MEPTTSLGKTLLACLTTLIATLTRTGGVPHHFRFILFTRIRRTILRLDALTAKFHAGKLPKPHAPRPPPATPRARKPLQPHQILYPNRKHWLVRMQHMTAVVGIMLDDALHSEDFKQLLDAAPQAGRLVRPLVRMFHMPIPEHLKRPERPKRIRPKTQKPEAEPLVINPHAHVPWGLGYRITRKLRKSGFTIAPRIPKISSGF